MAVEEAHLEQGLGLGDVVAVLKRRRWWFILPAAIGMLAATTLAFVLPAEFEAAATIVVEGQAVPESIAESTITANTESRYGNLRLETLSRENLSRVIDDFGLFQGSNEPREELIDRLRERIGINPLPPAIVDPRKPVELDSFRIAFTWPNATEAAAVANRLTRDFISANLKSRASLAEGTSEFIATELAKTRTQLQDVAQQITDYKENFQGELPEQLNLNRERLERARMDLAGQESKLEAAREQIIQLRKAVEEMRRTASDEEESPVTRKEGLDLHLTSLLSTGKTEKHPDVIRVRSEIAALEKVIEDLSRNPSPPSRDEIKLREHLRNFEVDASVHASEIERHKADIAEYEQRIENTPRRQAELDHLETSYRNLTDAIRALQLKKVEADMGRTIELANKGERFRIVESAVAPISPVSPNRPLLFIAGTLLGVMAGLALLVLREMSDESFHSVADLKKTLELPVLATVPVITLPAESARRRSRLLRWGAATGALLLLIAGGSALYLWLGSDGPARPTAAAGVERADV